MSRLRVAIGLGALLLTAGAAAGIYFYEQTPTVLLTHQDPHDQTQAAGPLAGPAVPDEQRPVGQAALNQGSSYAQQVPNVPPPPALTQEPVKRKGLWIESPTLKMALPIVPGDGGSKIPQWMALQYPGTAAPGAPGNSYLYAHGLWGMFGNLLFARTGDEVDLHNYDTGKVQVLHIQKIVGKVRYNDGTWLRQTSATPLLTLQTCTEFDPKADRYIVQAA